MNKYENEQFRVDEFSKVDEYQHFKAEDFKSLELLSVKNEEYRVEEIQKQSFVNDETKSTTHSNKKNNKVFDKLKNKILSSSSSTSASVSTALGSTGALLTAGVIGAGVVLSPVLDLPILNPIVEDYGSIEIKGYVIDVIESSTGLSYKVTIDFDEQINEEYKCFVVNNKTDEIKTLDTSLDEISFENLIDQENEFELLIKDSKDKTVYSELINVSTSGSISYTNNHAYEWLITYNQDDTYNAYYYPKYDYANNNIEIDAYLIDAFGNKINSNNKVLENVYYFEDISEDDFSLVTSGYLIENSNKYMIHNKTIKYESINTFDYQVTASEQLVNISIDENLSEDINVTLTYLDDNNVETYSYSKESWTGSVDIALTKKTEKVKVDIETYSSYDLNTNIDFVKYKGSINKTNVISEELFTNVSSSINLESIEILNESFENDFGIPTILKFDGYMIKDAYYKVNVYDSSNQLISETNNLTLLNVPVILYDLPTDQTLKFEYLVYDLQGNQLFANNHLTSLEIPLEYLDIESDVVYDYENPGSITRSFNDDGTINYYLYTGFENNSTYDVKARVSLYGDGNILNGFTQYSNEKVITFENLPNDQKYGVSYHLTVLDGIKHYVIDSGIIPSGLINDDRMDDGRYLTYIDVVETQTFKQYEVDLRTSINSDLNVEVIFDANEKAEFKILQSDVIDNKFMLDLSSYDFVEASINVSGIFNISRVRNEVLQEVTSLKGSMYHDVLATETVYIATGYISYTHYNVESRIANDANIGEEIVYKDIYIYLNSYLSDFFDCKVLNTNDNSYVLYDESLDYVVFTDLLEGEYNFELQIIDSNGKVYETTPLTINTESNIEYTTSPEHNMLITHNIDDDTYNFYYHPKFDYDNNVIESIFTLKDQDGNVIESDTRENLGIAFERLNHKSFMLEYKAYLKDQDNTYLIATSSTKLFELDNIPYVINRTSEDTVTLSFENKLASDLIVDVTYKDDNSKESFTITKEEWTGSTTIQLSKLSEDIEVNIKSTLEIFNQNEDETIDYYFGSLTKLYEYSETLSFDIAVQASLEALEILNETYSTYGSIPTTLKFKGYKKPNQTLTVNVYDSSNTIVNSVSQITDLNRLVIFEDLSTTEQLTFEYIIYDEDSITQLYKNTYQTTLVKPEEYTNEGITYTSFNPNDASLTFNEDGTFNAYIVIDFENLSSHDAYLRVFLEDTFDGSNSKIVYSNSSVVLLDNVVANTDYTLSYGLVIKDGINYYSVSDNNIPSGSILPYAYTDDGTFDFYVNPNEVSTSVYEFGFTNEITSDVNVTIILDKTTTETFTVSLEEIVDNVITIDMNQYQYSNATITLKGDAIIQYNATIESKVDTIVGVNKWAFTSTFTI